jgi:hypothetical protein
MWHSIVMASFVVPPPAGAAQVVHGIDVMASLVT